MIGCGQWGPNHIRIFSQLSNSCVLMCSDLDEGRLKSVKDLYPKVETKFEYKEILTQKEIDAVCIATPTNTHYSLTKEALQQNKHVLCEKPLALKTDECLELHALASQKNKILMVGHIFVFNAGIKWIKEYIKKGGLGTIYYAYSIRTNLGPFRYDVNALWDLAPHDISIFNYLFDSCPVSVSARGQQCLDHSLEDLTFATLEYPNDIIANVHVSWLDPKKVRQITVVGDKKMLVWDDLENDGPVKLYDKHVEKTSKYYATYGEFQLLSKEGSITIPKVESSEPLKTQGTYFIDCIENNVAPELSDAQKGLDVVKCLCSIQDSVNQKGKCIKVS